MGIRNLNIHSHLICVYLTPCLMPGKKWHRQQETWQQPWSQANWRNLRWALVEFLNSQFSWNKVGQSYLPEAITTGLRATWFWRHRNDAGQRGAPGGNALHSAFPPCWPDDQNIWGEKAFGFPSLAIWKCNHSLHLGSLAGVFAVASFGGYILLPGLPSDCVFEWWWKLKMALPIFCVGKMMDQWLVRHTEQSHYRFSFQRHRIELDTTLDDVHEKEVHMSIFVVFSLKPLFKVVEVVDLDSSMAALLGRLATKTDWAPGCQFDPYQYYHSFEIAQTTSFAEFWVEWLERTVDHPSPRSIGCLVFKYTC